MKAFMCWGCQKEYDTDEEVCPECGGELWSRDEVEGWQGIEDDDPDYGEIDLVYGDDQ